jgi:16S rRNA processing protein RimM
VERPHGLRGEMSVIPSADFASELRPGRAFLWRGDTGQRQVELESVRPAGNRLLVSIRGISSRDEAREVSGGGLYFRRGDLARPAEDYLFDDEVAAFECVSVAGERIGQAEGFERLAGACYLRLRRGRRSCLVPYTWPIVRRVSRADRRIEIDPPEGLWDL